MADRLHQNILFHSDYRSECTGRRFCQVKDECNPFPKRVYPYDNVWGESFFKQMKWEELSTRIFSTLNEFRLSCFQYIERYDKKPASLNNLTPAEAEENFFKG